MTTLIVHEGQRATAPRGKVDGKRFAEANPKSNTAELLHGVPLVTAGGVRIGKVSGIIIDAKTNQLRYIRCSKLVVPWHAIYFDSALVRLVFYTYSHPA